MGMLLSRHYVDKKIGAANTVAPSPSSQKEEKEIIAEEKKEHKELEITASDINKMTGTKLRKLAKLNGVADPEELTVNELKAILREKYS